MLCRKTVDLFTLLSHTQETGARRMGMTQELLALVTGLAHYLKILIRIALTGALKLERDYDAHEPMTSFLDKLHMLAIQGANPSAKRMIKGSNGETLASARSSNISTEGVTYGFRSLAPEYAGESPFMAAPRDPSLATVPTVNPPSDLCVKCNQTVEEDCVRLGTYQRWHSNCIQCVTCGKVAAVSLPKDTTSPRPEDKDKERDKDKEGSSSKPSTQRRPPANVGFFVYETDSMKDTAAFGPVPNVVCCMDHAHNGCRGGFQSVSRLEQYAFLLNVALRRLYTLLKKRGVVPASPGQWPKLEHSILPFSRSSRRLSLPTPRPTLLRPVHSGIAHVTVKRTRSLPQLWRHSPTQIRPSGSQTLGHRSYPKTIYGCGEPYWEDSTDKRYASPTTVTPAYIYAKTYAGTGNYLSKPTGNHSATTIDWSVSWTATDTDVTYTITRTSATVLTAAARSAVISATSETDAFTRGVV